MLASVVFKSRTTFYPQTSSPWFTTHLTEAAADHVSPTRAPASRQGQRRPLPPCSWQCQRSGSSADRPMTSIWTAERHAESLPATQQEISEITVWQREKLGGTKSPSKCPKSKRILNSLRRQNPRHALVQAFPRPRPSHANS